MIAALGLSTFKCETAGISLFSTSWGHLQRILAFFDIVAQIEHSLTGYQPWTKKKIPRSLTSDDAHKVNFVKIRGLSGYSMRADGESLSVN